MAENRLSRTHKTMASPTIPTTLAESTKKRIQDSLSASLDEPPSKAARNCSAADSAAKLPGVLGRPKDDSPHPDEIPAEDQATSDPHTNYDKGIGESFETLDKLRQLLQDPKNHKFCSEKRRLDWSTEIVDLTSKGCPGIIIGCLGASGVGKSSLLNALLNEAEILPTSGSRGCTATVVELRFNRCLVNLADKASVYRGVVEFISLQEWHDELQGLLDECCISSQEATRQGTISSRAPEGPDAAAAWSKINQVYGHGTMESVAGQPKALVWERLSQDPRLIELLTGKNENQANTIELEAGQVDAIKAKPLLEPMPDLKGQLKRDKAKWAKEFRKKINDYVYRKGNGKEPQSWPLIRKVTLYGPWAVLSTGACLVDLPGVRDANAARAKVAESYLQNCHKIWIVAPIKRAVDDKTAKDLLGAQFKRRLLMDGQYGNVSFICTHSDDCENTEIMRDHEDVVKSVEGRWDKIMELQHQIDAVEKEQVDLNEKEDELKAEREDMIDDIKGLKKDIRECKDNNGSSDSDDEDDDPSRDLKSLKASLKKLNAKLKSWDVKIKSVGDKVKDLDHDFRTRHMCLKALAAQVRNEYATRCLQEDFRAGLEEVVRKPDDEELDDMRNTTDEKVPAPMPRDYQLEVHCVSSNDYLKLQGLKTKSDGPPNTFATAQDTQIPALRSAVHATTAEYKHDFVSHLVSMTTNILERVKLFSTQTSEEEDADGIGKLCQYIFEIQVNGMDLQLISDDFVRALESKVNENLQPALLAGAKKGGSAVTDTISSWSDKGNCRTSQDRGPNQKGLNWKTYEATVKRNGRFVSTTAGAIDFNQELCAPAENEYCSNWNHTMNDAIEGFLNNAHLRLKAACSKAVKELVRELAHIGINSSLSKRMGDIAMRGCVLLVDSNIRRMKEDHVNNHRELSRSISTRVCQRMIPGYNGATEVARGRGFEKRMHRAMEAHSNRVGPSLLDEAVGELLDDVQKLIGQHGTSIKDIESGISDNLYKVFSMIWTDQGALKDSKARREIIACRNRLLGLISGLLDLHGKTILRVGLEPEDVDHAVMGVETWQDGMDKKMQKAKVSGDFVDLCDGDDDDDL